MVSKPMKFTTKDFIALTIPILLGILAWGIWLYEIVNRVGWESANWLRVPLCSVYIITGITVVSYLAPILMWSKAKWYVMSACILGMYLAAYGGYYFGRYLFTQLYLKQFSDKTHVMDVWALFFLVLAVSAVFFSLKQYFLFKSGQFHILTLMAVFISVIPASLATVEWFPGFGSTIGFIDAVKMGYPMLWVNILLGWTAYAMVRKLI